VSDSGGPGQREVAYRLFAAEFEDSDLSYSESDEERAPNYVVTPTGARVNRLFAVGVLTELEAVSEDVLRARVVDPTGAFVLYAGQYQPDEQAFLERAEPPAFVAVTGKARTFQPDDSDRVFTSVRPETISAVDAETRDRWTVGAAEQTLDRVTRMAAAKRLDVRGDDLEATLRERDFPDGLAEGIPIAFDHYGTTGEYLEAVRQMALEAARLVAGEIDEVEPLALAPGDGADALPEDLATADVGAAAAGTPATAVEGSDGQTAESGTVADAVPEDEDEDETPVTTSQTIEAETEPETRETETETRETGTETETPETEPATLSSGTETTAATGETTAGSDTDAEAGADEDLGDFDSAEFDLDEEQREEIESEFGTDFQSGTEVEEPGEADIETPEPESGRRSAEDTADELGETVPAEEEGTAEVGGSDASGADADDAAETAATADTAGVERDDDDSPAEPADMVDTVVEVMTELDDGAGADRDEVLDVVCERYDVSPEAVDDAVREALMDGRCYEPDDATLKPI
jgi:RPA family protein